MRVGVTAGGGGSGGTGTEAISADGAGASGVREGGNRAGTGSTGVTVYGAGLGRYEGSGQGRGGGTGSESTAWTSETGVVCVGSWRVSGLGSGQIVLTVTSLVGTGSDLVSYDRADVSGAVVSNQPSAYVTVRLLGKGYGLSSQSLSASVMTACQATAWQSESSLTCHASGLGPARSSGATLTVGGVAGGSVSEAITWDGGSLRRASVNAGSTGSGLVTVTGLGLGTVSLTGRGQSGSTAAESTSWMSESAELAQTSSVRVHNGAGTGSCEHDGTRIRAVFREMHHRKGG
ncbi:hypothetical protein GUITHDRAFT_98938 [Guillardia theta CCMP2712]|uniref:IPT/TIG domain-containing protein n=1 Tax=Guillardia theta (strain CCMP2712) TaxID=905079 RepID=L1K2V1_GUITC|nr:hypothetical protein GUITHDRAFT_98938 [Guillardia theta CCMP2712]EKX55156.1 hypothetical protein GUITHDRAFT_98938 [Guillardia theta CCMP2712]|eukprot:XP_005842136.1 hypothetical protein GUITHDRAFT_98938 [Guillardia theta CCMP2712]